MSRPSLASLPVSSQLWLEPLAAVHGDGIWQAVEASRDSLGPWLPWVDTTVSPTDCEVFVTAAMAERRLGIARHFALMEGTEGGGSELIGVVGFNRIVEGHRWATMGYWLRHDRQGAGRMAASVSALVAYGFNELALHRLEIRCAEYNTRSRAIPERLGFRQEGVLRDCEWVRGRPLSHVVYAMLAVDRIPEGPTLAR
ncbi:MULTISPECIES: GNAT family N-acetyltransferase [unclassified Halomonas]|uniref:GNAT family N-acetyltransferase n=1 Tax=unclassified Halomonas TaxID=2609666 RepID=UPI001C960778|nr:MULTISPECIES: GNAT family protein [unclassified Halomonas]MBY5925653.1 GNAT family N-acetyltransferase [Halomonas sp. DP4Y7-2]MBY6232528.1 GNAT family N-acetyltransferase [Halomonas sp. DP4Y7-1]